MSNVVRLINLVPNNVSSAYHLSDMEDEVGLKTVDTDFGPLAGLRNTPPVVNITGTGEESLISILDSAQVGWWGKTFPHIYLFEELASDGKIIQ